MLTQRKQKKCLVSGYNLAYYREGKGETILLIHGITTYSFIWRQIFSKLAKEYDVIAIDLLGCGESDKPLDIELSIKNHAELLKEFIEILGIKKFHIVGHDIGGGIAQVFSIRHPQYVLDMTLINTVGYDFWPVQPILLMRTPIIRQLAMATLDMGTFKLVIRRALYHKERFTPELMDYFEKPMSTEAGRKAFLHFSKCLNNQDLLDIANNLKKLDIPVLIIRGDADFYLSSQISEKLQEDIPGSKLKRIPTGGHFIQEDEPEKVIKELLDFYREKSYAEKS